MLPGTLLQEGVVVSHNENGVLVGRQAGPGEACPAGHSEHFVGEYRVFLSRDQAPIPPAGLHQVGLAPRRKAKKRK